MTEDDFISLQRDHNVRLGHTHDNILVVRMVGKYRYK